MSTDPPNYPPPPGGGYTGVPQGPPPPPASVLTAVKLMYLGAALSVVGVVLEAVSHKAIRKAVVKAMVKAGKPLTTTTINNEVTAITIIAVIVGLVGVGLWLWMAYANKAGKEWARITGTVFFGLDVLSLLFDLIGKSTPPLALGFALIIFVVGLLAVVFLWRSDSTAFFEAPR